MKSELTIKDIFTFFALKNENPNKILFQKYSYFLNYIGELDQYDFEPYTFGPYSFNLASDLKIMAHDGEIEQDNEAYIFKLDKNKNVDNGIQEQLSKNYRQFLDIVGDTSFDKLEITGTLMYCIKSMKYHEMPYDQFDEVMKEFNGWKRDKYKDRIEYMKSVYDKIMELYKTNNYLKSI